MIIQSNGSQNNERESSIARSNEEMNLNVILKTFLGLVTGPSLFRNFPSLFKNTAVNSRFARLPVP